MTTSKMIHTPASAAGTIVLGGELTVNRLGFGAMRLTGPGIWDRRGIELKRSEYSSARLSLGSTSSTLPTRTARTSLRRSSPRRCTPTLAWS